MKLKDNTIYYTLIKGRVKDEGVFAYVYHGKDSDLSFYNYKGKNLFGTVEFTEIYEEKRIKY